MYFKKFISILIILSMIFTHSIASLAEGNINIGSAISDLDNINTSESPLLVDETTTDQLIVEEETVASLSEISSEDSFDDTYLEEATFSELEDEFDYETESSYEDSFSIIIEENIATDSTIDFELSNEDNQDHPQKEYTIASFSNIDENLSLATISHITENTTFGDIFYDTTNYLFAPNWFDASVASLSSINDVQSITFLKCSDATPSKVDAKWDLPSSSNGLKGYTKEKSIYIYAPNDLPIHMAENSAGLFQYFKQLKEINNFNYLDTSNVTNMNSMFLLCDNLSTIDLSNFNTENVVDMSGMFSDCQSLTTLNLSQFNTHAVNKMNNMFANCLKLTTIIASSSFTTTGLQDDPNNCAGIFNNCPKLKGGVNTLWSYDNSSNIDYIRIDRGPIEPGFFTSPIPLPDIVIATFSILSSPSNLTYKAGTIFDPYGLKIQAKYTNGKLTDISYDNKTKTDFSFTPALGTKLTKNNQHIDITYAGITTTIKIHVLELAGIKLIASPSKLSYYTDNKLNPNGLIIECAYIDIDNNRSTESVIYNNKNKSFFSFEPALTKELTLQDKAVTVTFGDFKVTYNITVTKGNDRSPSGGNNKGNTGGTGRGGVAGPSAGAIPASSLQNPLNPLSQNGMPINKSKYGMLAILNSTPLTDVIQAANGTYLHQNGGKITGLNKVKVNNEDGYYYFKNDSSLYTGWMKDENNNLHYFGADGKMMAGKTVSINGFTCSFNDTGDLNLNNLNFELKSNILANCFIKLDTGVVNYEPTTNAWRVQITNPLTNEKEYAKGLTTLVQDDGVNTYYFDASGIMQVGYQYVNGSLMYFDPLTGKKVNNI